MNAYLQWTRGLLLLVLLVPAWAIAGGEEPLFEGDLHLVPVKPAPVHERAWSLPRGTSPASKPTTFLVRLGRATLHLVDLDGDGRVVDEGVDGWCVAGAVYLLPFERPLVIGDVLVDVRQEAGADEVHATARRVQAPAEQRSALRAINAVRTRNGIPPVRYDAALSEACRLHCLYCGANGLTHVEDPSASGYSASGAKAGRDSNLASGAALDRAGAWAFRTLYHRRTVMDPATRAMGFGAGKGYVAVDGLTRTAPRAWSWPSILPAPDTGGQPTAYDPSERPRPVPSKPLAGLPVTLRWPAGTTFADVKARMETARRHRAVPVHLSWPGHPAHPSMPGNQDSICLIPYGVLRPLTTYRVTVEARVDGAPYQRSFQFRTGRR